MIGDWESLILQSLTDVFNPREINGLGTTQTTETPSFKENLWF